MDRTEHTKFFLKFHLCVHLFLAVLGLHCCVGFSLVVVSRGSSPVQGLLIAVTSLIVELRL